MNIFFIIGLPRTRSAWLANLLTDGNWAICLHELMSKCQGVADFKTILEGFGKKYTSAGDSDPSLCTVLPAIMAAFPNAKFVFIKRPVREAYASYMKAFPNFIVKESDFWAWADAMENAFEHLQGEGKGRAMTAQYADLNDFNTVQKIHMFCLEQELGEDRFQLLTELRVTTNVETVYPTLAPWAKNEIVRKSAPQSETDKAWEELMREMCGDNKQAFDWLMDLLAVALTWDHIIDQDPINLAVADQCFEAVLLKWPFNGWYAKHAPFLAPVMNVAVNGWRHGSRERHFDCYSEPALAVAYLIGGKDHADRFAPRVHKLIAEARAVNDSKPNQEVSCL